MKTLDALVTERDFQQTVLELARVLGWRCYHTHDSRRSEPGFPDIVAVRPPRIIYAELKTERGRLSADQRQWLSLLEGCAGVEVHVWRPSDWPAIDEALR